MRSGGHGWSVWLGVLACLVVPAFGAAAPYDDSLKAGQRYLARGDARRAEAEFERAAQADPNQSLPLKYLVITAARGNDLRKAVAASRRAAAVAPNDDWIQYNLGIYLLNSEYAAGLKPSEETVKALKRAVELNGRQADAACNLGLALYLLARYDEAIPYLERAAAITPYFATFHSNLGEALLAAGKAKEATEAFARAAESQRLRMLKGQDLSNVTADLFLGWAKAEVQLQHLGNARNHLLRMIADVGREAGQKAKVEEARRLLADIERRLKEEQDALRRRREEEEAKRKQQDAVKPVVRVTSPNAEQAAREVVLVRGDEKDGTGRGVVVRARATDTLLVSGVATDNIGVTEVTVAGKRADLGRASTRDLEVVADPDSSVSFSADVTLSPGENRILVVALDKAGNKGTAEIIIRAKVQDTLQVAQSAVAEVAAAAAQRWAVLVGVNQYEDPDISPLKFAVSDVRKVHELLLDPKRSGFKPENVTLLTDDQGEAARKPTRRNVYDALYRLQLTAKEDDLIVVYYSGHGFRDKATDMAYLLPMDTATHDLSGSAIANDDFLARLAKIRAKKKVVILDACHSGGVGLGARAEAKLPPAYYDLFGKSQGTVTMASCSGDEQAYEFRRLGQGAFTYFLCEGLTGKADGDRNGVVTFQEAAQYVTQTVKEWAAREGLQQTPHTHTGNVVFDIPLSAVREVELEQKKMKVMATFADPKVQQLSLSLLEREPQALNDPEKLALTVLEQVFAGESRKELYEDLVRRFNLVT